MNLEEQLREAFAPCEPGPAAEAAVMAYVFGGAKRSVRGKPDRRILFGTLLLVAAAAAVLLVHIAQPPAPAAVLVAPPDSPAATVAEAAAPAEPVAGPQPAEAVAPEEVAAPLPPFTAQVMPLVNEATEPSAIAALQSLHASFVERLRAVPGLTLLQQDQAGASQVRPDFRITLHGRETGKVGSFGGSIQTDTLNPDGTPRSNSYMSFSGDVAPPCAGTRPADTTDADAGDCRDPRGVGVDLVMQLRVMAFPSDPSLRKSLQARLANRSMDARLRLRALSDLDSLGRFRFAGNAAPNEALRDPAVVRAAIDLATTAADPVQRARVWSLLRGVGNAELAPPLLAALRQDRDGEVRLAALGTLVAGFREDEGFHQALEAAAQRDAQPLIRALARRVLDGAAGEAAWRDYIADSLQDASRSSLERIEALFYQLGLPMTAAYSSGMRGTTTPARTTLRQLDGAALRALTEALSEVAQSSPIVQRSAAMLWTDLGQIDHPAITEALLASLNDGSHWMDRGGVIKTLAEVPARRSDPRVHAVLEKISASDPDPRVRQVAATALQPPAVPVVAGAAQAGAAASATGAGQPPRLGIGLAAVEAGSFAPQELIGKTLVTAVGPGTVAEKAGMQEGDVLLEINDMPLPSPAAIPGILASIPRGVDVDLLVNRLGENLKLKARF